MIAALLAIAAVYPIGWRRLSKAGPNIVSIWQPAAFMGGLAAVWLAAGSPLAELDHRLLTAHMAQHLILMIVAAPLMLLAAPLTVLLHALPTRFVPDRLSSSWRLPLIDCLARICTHPVFCWLAGSITVMAWHVPAIFDLALASHRWHEIERACFLVAGLLFWRPVIQPWPNLHSSSRWTVPLYLFLATLPCDALSAFLAFSEHVVYRPYASEGGAFNLSPLQDQSLAGALMWVAVTFGYLIPALAITSQILSGPPKDLPVASPVRT